MSEQGRVFGTAKNLKCRSDTSVQDGDTDMQLANGGGALGYKSQPRGDLPLYTSLSYLSHNSVIQNLQEKETGRGKLTSYLVVITPPTRVCRPVRPTVALFDCRV
jgi:hypothetical protein